MMYVLFVSAAGPAERKQESQVHALSHWDMIIQERRMPDRSYQSVFKTVMIDPVF